jgi:hypothetical protein
MITDCREGAERRLQERLERGEVVPFPTCPFPAPAGADLAFLLEQRLSRRAHKNIAYDPATGRVTGHARSGEGQTKRLRGVLADFSSVARRWLGAVLPRYASGWDIDRVSFRPEEEATRRLRLTARNDLMHVDAFPSRPTNGWRIFRFFVNINPSEPRIWVTGEPFARLLERYGRQAGLPDDRPEPLFRRLSRGVLRLVRPGRRPRSAYDSFMLRFHNFLKANEDFQANGRLREWEFLPGAAWMVVTDTASHAVLRGRYALEHSFFLDPGTLALPDESPAALLRKACGRSVLRGAA